VRCRLREGAAGRLVAGAAGARIEGRRGVYFADTGWVEATVHRFEAVEGEVAGPAIIESSFTTVVLDPGAVARWTTSGSLSIAV
jgi:N-methylhydantoinase A